MRKPHKAQRETPHTTPNHPTKNPTCTNIKGRSRQIPDRNVLSIIVLKIQIFSLNTEIQHLPSLTPHLNITGNSVLHTHPAFRRSPFSRLTGPSFCWSSAVCFSRRTVKSRGGRSRAWRRLRSPWGRPWKCRS